MPKYIGGDIIEITVNHPTAGEFRFQAKANESFNVDPGGLRSNDDASAITGGGDIIDQVNRVRWSIEGPVAVDVISGNEIENLPLLAESPDLGTWTLEHISGVVWKGLGKIVGDITADTNTAQMTLKVAGSGKLEKIS
jgi:hypothetical protein